MTRDTFSEIKESVGSFRSVSAYSCSYGYVCDH